MSRCRMIGLARVRPVFFLSVLMAGCRPTPEALGPFPGYTHVRASRDCPPAGGYAVSIVLRPVPVDSFEAMGPQLRVGIWRDARSLPGQTFASADRPSSGGGYECSDSTTCQPLRSWRVRVASRESDSSLVGELEVRGTDGNVRRGRFHAPWQPRVVYCI